MPDNSWLVFSLNERDIHLSSKLAEFSSPREEDEDLLELRKKRFGERRLAEDTLRCAEDLRRIERERLGREKGEFLGLLFEDVSVNSFPSSGAIGCEIKARALFFLKFDKLSENLSAFEALISLSPI